MLSGPFSFLLTYTSVFRLVAWACWPCVLCVCVCARARVCVRIYVLKCFCRSHKEEVKAVLASDPGLVDEIDFDLRRFEKEEHERRQKAKVRRSWSWPWP